MTWQRRALEYVDEVPELSYSSRFYARMLRQLRIFPATMEGGRFKEIETGPPVEALARLKGKDGTMKPVLSSYGRLMFITGEGDLLGLKIGAPDEHWSFVWTDEVDVEQTNTGQLKKLIHKPRGDEKIEYGPNEAWISRMWTPHPRRSGEADSPMRSVLKIAEELIALTDAVRSTAVSRTVAGLLLMPTEMAPLPATAEGDEDPVNDPFVNEMLEHLESQIEDVGSAAASAPWVIWGAYELLDRIRRVDLHDPQTDYMERDLRKEAVERMSRGLDFPPEVLTGLSASNHWAAKQIMDDMWRSHGGGVADQFVGDVNDAYLRPAMREAQYEGWEDLVIGYDESRVVVPPDQSADADTAYDRGQISGDGYRRLKNIPDTYAPSEEEHDEYLAIKMRDMSLLNGVEPPDPSDQPPPAGPEGDSGRKTRVVEASLEMGAAQMALARCRELAGVRIKQKEKVCPECLEGTNGLPLSAIAASLGHEKIEKLSVTPQALVKGGADTLRDMLAEWGYAKVQATALAEMVESYAARTLFKVEHPQFPSGFITQFERAREASDVSN
jgi:hypothetical protein